MRSEAIHPGEHLAEELEERCMSAADLARQLELPTAGVVDILAGRAAITDVVALRLAHIFGASAQFWMNLQSLYDLNKPNQSPAAGD
jgi:antitoxin HigA-1